MTVPYEVYAHIQERKAQYCFIDTRSWDALKGLLADDLNVSFYGVDGALAFSCSGREQFLSATMSFLEGSNSSHVVANAELSQREDGDVTAVWAMRDYVVHLPTDDRPGSAFRGYGHYYEVWRQVDGAWLMTRLELRRSLVEQRAGQA